jgi:hypothetical protein
MVAKPTRPTHKIAIQLHLVAESCTICSYRSRRPVRKLFGYTLVCLECSTDETHGSVPSGRGSSLSSATLSTRVRTVARRTPDRNTHCRRDPIYCLGTPSSLHGLAEHPGRFPTVFASAAYDGRLENK